MLTKCGKRKNYFRITKAHISYLNNINDLLEIYGVNLPYILGKGMLSRTCFNLQTQVTKRSKPNPNPAWGTEPYLRKSKYHSNASIGN
jgi:hypothetical protein